MFTSFSTTFKITVAQYLLRLTSCDFQCESWVVINFPCSLTVVSWVCIFVPSSYLREAFRLLGLPLVAQKTVKNLPVMQETRVQPLGQADPLEKRMATHSSILAWRIPMDRGDWWATVHGVAKSQARLSDYHSHYLFRLLAMESWKFLFSNLFF